MRIKRYINLLVLAVMLITLSSCSGEKDYKAALEVYNSGTPDRHERAYNMLVYVKTFKKVLFLELPNDSEYRKARELMQEIKEDYNRRKMEEFQEIYKGHRVAFVEEDRESEKKALYTSNIDGSDKRLLYTESDFYIETPRWSPDGTKIVFELLSDICIINSDGSGFTKITDSYFGAREPNWSPDGTKILFLNSHNDIFVYSFDSEKITKRYDKGGAYTATWLKNSHDILFFTAKDIYILKDGKDEAVQYNTTLPEESNPIGDLQTLLLSFSSENAQLSNNGNMVAVHNEGIKIINLTDGTINSEGIWGASEFSWSPDDRYIVSYIGSKSPKIALTQISIEDNEWNTYITLFPGESAAISPVPIKR